MVATFGLVGLRPAPAHVAAVASPPYDVIKAGTPLDALLAAEARALDHVILGDRPAHALARLRDGGFLVADEEPSYYVYEQRWGDETRTGVLVAGEVSDYAKKQVIRHEKTFDDKVVGRIALKKAIGHYIGPVFLLTRAPLSAALDACKSDTPLYTFTTDLHGLNDLHGIRNRIWRVTEASEKGRAIQRVLGTEPMYIADGHHRYHAALRAGFPRFVGYVTEQAKITAYDRVVNGTVKFADARGALTLEEVPAFVTPPKHVFCLYSGGRAYFVRAKDVPSDVVGGLDCSILEREVYPALGLRHEMIKDPAHFDYYPEWALADMKAVVDRGDYDLAIALHPVGIDELVAVADAGLGDPEIVMPEKSTFFAPKVLSGIFLQRLP
jgi:uncharacterized protein (DUF1015 family)